MTIKIHALKSLVDNYIWAIEQNNAVTVVDPGSSEPVLTFLAQHNLALTNILITHHHYDHIGGVAALYSQFPQLNLFGPDLHRIAQTANAQQTQTFEALSTLSDVPIQVVSETARLDVPSSGRWQVMHTPGHTYDHLSYYQPGHLFCADTLFSVGCGRAFTNKPALLYASLCRIAQLPDDTLIYPAHEYTLKNLAFAEHIEPENSSIQKHIHSVRRLRDQDSPSLPTSLGLEKQINPFLRCALPSVRDRINKISGKMHDSPESVFITMRALKDVF